MAIAPSLPAHSRLAMFAALAGMAASGASFFFPKVPVGLLCFYFPLCWVLWIASAILSAGKRPGVLVVIWNIVNTSILLMFLSITSSLGDVRGSQGTELVWGMSYLPMILPLGWIFGLPFFNANPLSAMFIAWFGSAFGGVVGDWLIATFMTLGQSLVIMLLAWGPATLLQRVLNPRGNTVAPPDARI